MLQVEINHINQYANLPFCRGTGEVVRKHKTCQVCHFCETDLEIMWVTAKMMSWDCCIYWVRLLISKAARNLSYLTCTLKVYCYTQLGVSFHKTKFWTFQFLRATCLLSSSWYSLSLWNTSKDSLVPWVWLQPKQREWALPPSADITQQCLVPCPILQLIYYN